MSIEKILSKNSENFNKIIFLSREEKEKLFNQTDAKVPDGQYHAVLMMKNGERTKSGFPVEKLSFRILDGDYKNKWVFCSLFLTQSSIASTRKMLSALPIGLMDDVKKESDTKMIVKISIQKNKYNNHDLKSMEFVEYEKK